MTVQLHDPYKFVISKDFAYELKIVNSQLSSETNSEWQKEIYRYSLNVIQKSYERKDKCDFTIKDSKRLFGKLLFLAERVDCMAASVLNYDDVKMTNDAINLIFDCEISKLCSKYAKMSSNRERKMFLQRELPLELGKYMVTGNGFFNFNIIDPFLGVFVADVVSNENYLSEFQLAEFLKLISGSFHIKKHLTENLKIPNPQDPDLTLASNSALRLSLGLNNNAPIDEIAVKKAIMTAFLSHYSVGPLRNTYTQVGNFDNKQDFVLMILRKLSDFVHQGYLEATKGQRQVRINPTLAWFDDYKELNNKISFNRSGKIADSDTHLWDNKGLIAVCNYAQIASPQIAIQEVIDSLFCENEDELATVIFAVLVEMLSEKGNCRSTKLLKLVFLSGQENLLMRLFNRTLTCLKGEDALDDYKPLNYRVLVSGRTTLRTHGE